MSVSFAMATKDYNKAIATLEKELDRNPGDGFVRWELATCHLWNGEPDKAIQVLEPLEKNGNLDFDTFYLLARCHSELGDHSKAYSYACLAYANPPDTHISVPKILEWLPGIKEANRKGGQALWNNLVWIREYKVWCEENLGYRNK